MPGGTRGTGIPVNPQKIRDARLAAGLTMEQLGGGKVSRAHIHYLEIGSVRPSRTVLEMIARKTGKTLSYFTSPGRDSKQNATLLAGELTTLATRVKRLADLGGFNVSEKQALRLLESSLRQGAILARNLARTRSDSR